MPFSVYTGSATTSTMAQVPEITLEEVDLDNSLPVAIILYHLPNFVKLSKQNYQILKGTFACLISTGPSPGGV